jgi:hypothetical protein
MQFQQRRLIKLFFLAMALLIASFALPFAASALPADGFQAAATAAVIFLVGLSLSLLVSAVLAVYTLRICSGLSWSFTFLGLLPFVLVLLSLKGVLMFLFA